MRQIKFRAKDKDKNWICGDLIHGVGEYNGSIFILPISKNLNNIPNCDPINGVLIDENTICQFTRLFDDNRKEIYEGDIIQSLENDKSIYIIVYDDEFCSFKAHQIHCKYGVYCSISQDWIWETDKVIIGNVFDNQELLNDTL